MSKINTFDPAYLPNVGDNQELIRQWRNFQAGRPVSGMRSFILESWQRCREMGVNPEANKQIELGLAEFKIILQEEKRLLEVATPILERVYGTLRSGQLVINLANADGVCLKTWRNASEIDWIKPGMSIQEGQSGTAGMPLCLLQRKPVVVYGGEHYCAAFHNLACIAAPIMNEAGLLLGGISISFNLKNFHPWSLTFIQEAAINIAEQLRLREILDVSDALLETFAEGVIVASRDGAIRHMNEQARNMLGVSEKNFPLSIEDVLQGECSKQFKQGRSFANKEVRLKNCCGAAASRTFIASFSFRDSICMINLRNAKNHYDYVAKTAGTNAYYNFDDILGSSSELRKQVSLAWVYAKSDANVLILGESGTGKELFAHAIHNGSKRRSKPFVAVNCGALPRELVQSELFGYVEGAFTGARKRGNPGKFALAEGGTLFLDEIGEMELTAQASLLRFLESGEIARIGDNFSRRVDVRVIAATNSDLQATIKTGRFRADLYHRLNVFTLKIPALRERPSDIAEIAQAVLQRFPEKYPELEKRILSSDALNRLMEMPWPGNVRELEHYLERLLFISGKKVIEASDLGNSFDSQAELMQAPEVSDEKNLLLELLRRHNGDIPKIAQACGVGKTTIYSRLKQYGLDARQYRKLRIINSEPG